MTTHKQIKKKFFFIIDYENISVGDLNLRKIEKIFKKFVSFEFGFVESSGQKRTVQKTY